jgi:hypothetical protein
VLYIKRRRPFGRQVCDEITTLLIKYLCQYFGGISTDFFLHIVYNTIIELFFTTIILMRPDFLTEHTLSHIENKLRYENGTAQL